MSINDSNISIGEEYNNIIRYSKSAQTRDGINPFCTLPSENISNKPKCNLEVKNLSYIQPTNQNNSFQNNKNQQINNNNNENQNNIFQPTDNVAINMNIHQNLDQEINSIETKLRNQNKIINEIGQKINQLSKGKENLSNEISELFNQQKKDFDEQLKALEEIVKQNMDNKNISNNNNNFNNINNNININEYNVYFIDNNNNKMYEIKCHENEKINSIISKYGDFAKVSPYVKKFFFKNEELNSSKSCKEAGLFENSVIYVNNYERL